MELSFFEKRTLSFDTVEELVFRVSLDYAVHLLQMSSKHMIYDNIMKSSLLAMIQWYVAQHVKMLRIFI